MNKILFFFIISLITYSCSFNKNSKFWSNSESIVSEKIGNYKEIFPTEEALQKEFNSNLQIKFDISPVNNTSINNYLNNNGRLNFDGNLKKSSRYKFSKIENFNQYQPEIAFFKNNLFFFDNKGSILKFDENSKLIWKKNFYSKSEKKLQPILQFVNNNKYLIVADNIAKYYMINIDTGNLIWSNYFNNFLLSVGDMGYKFNSSDTTTPKGKVLLLNIQNNDGLFEIPIVSDEKNSTPLNNVIAYGLRNPWKTYEYENYLFIPDIGYNDMEELNILDLSNFKKSIYFGWPVYEGINKSSDEFFPISYWAESGKVNLIEFAEEFTIFPKLYYEHNSPDVYRAAIIGGDVINDKNSEYYKIYIFADYLSKELFAYNFISDKISILPLPDDFDTYITSLIVNPLENDSVLITTGVGELIEINLP